MSDYQAWQTERHTYVTSPTGNLALVNYQPVSAEAKPIEEIPATVRREGAEEGIRLTAKKEDNVTVDGQVVDGEVMVGRLQADGTPIVKHGHYSLDVFSLDGSEYEMRIYNAEADHLKKFDRIDYYDYDASLVIEGTYRAHDATDEVAWDFTRSSDSGHTKKVPGIIDVSVDGQNYSLAAFTDGPLLVLVYADGTTGKESYAPGRFLKMPLPNESGKVTIDFNQTFIPPCGFSYSYSCPIPPPQNRIAAPIRGGEREVVWKEQV